MCAGAAALPLLHLACSAEGAAQNGADAGDNGGWATGGTVSMTDKESYPEPFPGALASCVLVASTTDGPCTTESDLDREDVSESWTGLPVRLALKVANDACEPIAGAVVKIWHTNIEGIYSGATPRAALCSGNNQDYIAANFFRGVRTTGDDGVVFFDTCFPGWYGGRAIHIHFQVKNGDTS